jgi:hypothetical protein
MQQKTSQLNVGPIEKSARPKSSCKFSISAFWCKSSRNQRWLVSSLLYARKSLAQLCAPVQNFSSYHLNGKLPLLSIQGGGVSWRRTGLKTLEEIYDPSGRACRLSIRWRSRFHPKLDGACNSVCSGGCQALPVGATLLCATYQVSRTKSALSSLFYCRT